MAQASRKWAKITQSKSVKGTVEQLVGNGKTKKSPNIAGDKRKFATRKGGKRKQNKKKKKSEEIGGGSITAKAVRK